MTKGKGDPVLHHGRYPLWEPAVKSVRSTSDWVLWEAETEISHTRDLNGEAGRVGGCLGRCRSEPEKVTTELNVVSPGRTLHLSVPESNQLSAASPCLVWRRHAELSGAESPLKRAIISSDWPGLTVRECELVHHELHRVCIKMKIKAATCRQEGWRGHWKSERLATHHITCGLSGDRGNESETYILDQ